MENHVKILAILYLAFSVLGLIGALVLLMIFGGVAGILHGTIADQPDAAVAIPIIGLVGGILVILVLVLSIPGIIAGIGLLNYQEWARILTLVLSALNLIHVPFGTLLGAYGLWVLLQEQTVQLFARQKAMRA